MTLHKFGKTPDPWHKYSAMLRRMLPNDDYKTPTLEFHWLLSRIRIKDLHVVSNMSIFDLLISKFSSISIESNFGEFVSHWTIFEARLLENLYILIEAKMHSNQLTNTE